MRIKCRDDYVKQPLSGCHFRATADPSATGNWQLATYLFETLSNLLQSTNNRKLYKVQVHLPFAYCILSIGKGRCRGSLLMQRFLST